MQRIASPAQCLKCIRPSQCTNKHAFHLCFLQIQPDFRSVLCDE
jgi:hypothetical protein